MSTLVEEVTDIDLLVSEAEKLVDRRSHDALPLAQKIMTLALNNGDPRHYAQAKYILAFYNCLVANDYDKAIAFCEDVLRTLDEREIEGVLYKIYMTLGNSYHLKGEVFSAEQCYMKGLKLLQNKKDELSRNEKGLMASFYYNLSILLSSSQLAISAEEYLEKAIELYKEVQNDFKLSKGYIAYATVLSKRKEYVRAIEFLHKSLEIDTRLNDPYSIALSKANLGIYHLRLGDHQLAFEYINTALNFYQGNNMVYETAMVKKTLAEALYSVDKRDEAIVVLQEAEKLFVELDNRHETTSVYETLSAYLEEKGDLKAISYYRKYTEGLKYFFDVEKTNALTRAKKEFETEQKEKETAMLREKNEQIKRYVNKLEHSNDQLQQFASVASHDLREPLRMISSYTGLLRKTLADQISEQQKEFMNFIVDGAKRMDQMMTDLLRLAKVDANPRLEEVKLNSVVEEIRLNISVLMEERKAVVISKDLPKITADRTMILQLFQNIIGNGIKYNESAIPTIKLKWRKLPGKFEIIIADNGIGIPDNLREKAFHIFHRLPTKKEYSGSGIGLAICKKIVDSMDGTITISNNQGGGTVFTICLPAELLQSW